MDHFKQFVCNKNGIPLVVLKLYKFYKDDEIRDMLNSHLKNFQSRYNFPVFCTKCNAPMNYKNNQDGSFYYACSNPECKKDTDPIKPYTIDEQKIAPLIKES